MFCVSLDHYGFVFSKLVLLELLLSLLIRAIAAKNVSKMTFFCVEFDVNPNSVNLPIIFVI